MENKKKNSNINFSKKNYTELLGKKVKSTNFQEEKSSHKTENNKTKDKSNNNFNINPKKEKIS